MATTNGTQSALPPTNSLDLPTTSSIKRKREESIEGSANLGVNSTSSIQESQAMVRDLIDVLKIYDTTPSILTRQIPDRRGSEPQTKRQKGEEVHVPQTNILERVLVNGYKDLDHALEDIDIAAADIIDILQLPNGASRNQYVPVPASQSELSMKVNAFKQRAHELVRRENIAMRKGAITTKANPGAGAITQVNASSDANKVVLTLYGNAGGAKQLFSSFQIPTKISGESKDILQPIREAGLPNGITTTQIVPIQSTGLSSDKKRVATLGELFPTPASVPAMLPPKPSKLATTRSETVGWYHPAANDSVSRTASYFRQSISSGQWLDYSTTTISHQTTKKKSRDRGLSFGGSKAASHEGESTESEASKLETLFRSVYSGFAPTKDESAAVIPVGTMDKMWWQQVGEKSFSRMVQNFETLDSVASSETEVEYDRDEDLRRFEKLVQELEDDPIDPRLLVPEAKVEKSIEEKDVEEILEGISELLETLNSYQEIRNSSLSSSNRSAGSLSVPDTGSFGTPAKPNEAEQNTYEIIKSQLSLMIATLPPYAVAKLDANRLSRLSIGTRIEVAMNDCKGVMEEDEFAARAKAATISAASATARIVQPPAMHRPSTTALYGNQYAPPAPRVIPTPAHQYYNGAQTPIRPPTNNMQRPPATAPVYQNPRPAGNAPYRPANNYGTPTYPHQARPVQQQQQQQYAPQPQHQYQQHTPVAQPYMRPAGQSYQQMPQSAGPVQMNGRYTPQQGYPHKSHQVAAPQSGISYGYNNAANVQRQASPQKPMYNSPQPSQARPSYSTPTPVTGMNRQAYQQQPQSQALGMNGGSSHIPQPQFAQQPATNSGYSTFMNASEQASLMDRQRAQLAHQQATSQQQARNAMQASMGSPPRGQPNGINPVAANS